MQFWTDLLLSPPIIIAALVIGVLGEVTKNIVQATETPAAKPIPPQAVAPDAEPVPPPNAEDGPYRAPVVRVSGVPARAARPMFGWRRLYHVTLPAHPVILGVLLGFIPWLPPAEGLTKVGYEMAGRVGTYALAGVVCKISYDTLVSTVKRAIETRAGVVVGGGGSVHEHMREAERGETAEDTTVEG